MAHDVFAAVANPVRRRVLELLLEKPMNACEIAAEFDLERPSVSEHLQVLRRHGLVLEAARGRERRYSLNPEALMEIGQWMRPFELYWRERMTSLRAALDEDKDEDA